MNSKKKMIIAISAFALVVLATVVSVVAVLAAQQVIIESSISVTYTVNDVYGFAKVSYKVEGDEEYTEWLEEKEFTGLENEDQTLVDPNIELSKTQTYVIIKFEFKKTDTTVEDFSAQLSYENTSLNHMSVTTGTEEGSITEIANVGILFNETIDSDFYSTYFVKISLEDTKYDADFNGTFNWVLSNIES